MMSKEATIVFDGGTSNSKIIASFPNTSSVFNEEKHYLVSPWIRQIDKESYQELLEEKIEESVQISLNDSLISFVDPKTNKIVYWQISTAIARKGILFLEDRKFENLMVKILAFVGYLAKNYHREIEINLGILLPLDEIDDRRDLAKWLRQIFDGDGFRINNKKVNNMGIKRLNIKPEGYGIVKNSSTEKTGIFIIGHNDLTWLYSFEGNIRKDLSKTFPSTGMHDVINKLKYPIIDEFEAARILSEAGEKSDRETLRKLTQTKSDDELDRLIEELNKARKKYWRERREDICNLSIELADEVFIGGGAAHYFKEQIQQLFKKHKIKVNWCSDLKKEFCQRFNLKISNKTTNLFLDCYSYFKFLNEIKASDTNTSNVVEQPALKIITSN